MQESRSVGFGFSPNNWMASLPDSISISEILIPGTHDSGAIKYVASLGRCQTLTIDEQLYRKGVRFLDIGCKVADNKKLSIYHGKAYEELSFDDVLNSCRKFLQSNPKEAIIMSIKNEARDFYHTKFDQVFLSQYYNQDPIWFGEDVIPTLGQVRGKIILFRRFESNDSIGIDASPKLWKDNIVFDIPRPDKTIRVQDKYTVTDGREKYDINLKPMLEESNDKTKWYIHFASAIKMNEILPNAAIISDDVNPLLNSFFDSNPSFGVILMDFIDQDAHGDHLNVSSKIIARNFIFE